MDVNSEISTPVDSSQSDTSNETVLETSNTTDFEPVENNETAEIEENEDNQTEQTEVKEGEAKKYAGKYDSAEELEKAYKETEPYITKVSELEKKLQELTDKQEEKIRTETQAQLERVKSLGFNTIEEANIANQVSVAEAQYFYDSAAKLDVESSVKVKTLLEGYINTGDVSLLAEAKDFFPNDFIEHVATEKTKYQMKLENEFQNKKAEDEKKQKEQFYTELEANNKDFLADLEENEAKKLTLSSLLGCGVVNSQADMDVVKQIYQKIFDAGVSSVKAKNDVDKDIQQTKEKLQTIAGASSTAENGETWFTREQWLNMSGRDLEKHSDKIDKQMQLEAQGKIPKAILD